MFTSGKWQTAEDFCGSKRGCGRLCEGNKDGDVVLTAGENSVTVKTSDLGLTWGNTQVVDEAVGIGKSGNLIKRYKDKKDLEIRTRSNVIVYTVDTQKVTEVLNEQASKLDQKAVNASPYQRKR